MVTQFREALDKEESSSSLNRTTSKPSRTDEISVATSTKHFEIFVKRIGKRSLADARRLRNDVNGQIRKTKILVGQFLCDSASVFACLLTSNTLRR